ncbi:hypothetical protein EC2741950_4810 [Escherichia coli 2741950]|nr:hypothetical protein EC2741950_4810 [Escherichia coli 2741950]
MGISQMEVFLQELALHQDREQPSMEPMSGAAVVTPTY